MLVVSQKCKINKCISRDIYGARKKLRKGFLIVE